MDLPEGCIANILSRTTPSDACRLSVVSKLFRSAADSDVVWGRFLPSDVVSIISQSDSQPSLLASFSSKKALYLALSDRPLIIDEGKKSFQLDRKSGKKCYMLAARALVIVWGSIPEYWRWITLPESRLPEVAQLIRVSWVVIHGVINTIDLSPNTQYAAYLVFKMVEAYGFQNLPVELLVAIGGETSIKNVCLDPNSRWMHQPNRVAGLQRPIVRSGPNSRRMQQPNRVAGLQRPIVRSDGWLEIEMGGFKSGIENEKVWMSVINGDDDFKRGLTIQGIEVRPKEDN